MQGARGRDRPRSSRSKHSPSKTALITTDLHCTHDDDRWVANKVRRALEKANVQLSIGQIGLRSVSRLTVTTKVRTKERACEKRRTQRRTLCTALKRSDCWDCGRADKPPARSY